ncbi:MAG: type III toxin-antitoxin system ToxN/AbiQ family toxin [Lachnospiraceae bacterium]|nr:type III toxin-antitoxin system ToxN/AbiQ family toxin [Lachnospiraceae bacterium]
MKFYNVTNRYIDYLKKSDPKVPDNKGERRPYIGIVLELNNVQYYVPFTSPKRKHKEMKNGLDFRKIHGGEYGAINFNNMLPVVDSELILLDIEKENDISYQCYYGTNTEIL